MLGQTHTQKKKQDIRSKVSPLSLELVTRRKCLTKINHPEFQNRDEHCGRCKLSANAIFNIIKLILFGILVSTLKTNRPVHVFERYGKSISCNQFMQIYIRYK